MTTRRLFLAGVASLIAAPAIVRADNLMKLWVPPKPKVLFQLQGQNMFGDWIDLGVVYDERGVSTVRENDLFALMGRAIVEHDRDWTSPREHPVRFLAEKKTIDQMHLQAIRDRQVLLQPKPSYSPFAALTYRGIPVEQVA